jgi:hypothetical protein
VARIVKKRRNSSKTRAEMEQRAKAKKMLEPTETGDTERENIVGGGGEGEPNERENL